MSWNEEELQQWSVDEALKEGFLYEQDEGDFLLKEERPESWDKEHHHTSRWYNYMKTQAEKVNADLYWNKEEIRLAPVLVLAK